MMLMNIFQAVVEMVTGKQFFLCVEIVSYVTMIIVGFFLTKAYLCQDKFLQKKDYTFYFLLSLITCLLVEYTSWIVALMNWLQIVPIDRCYVNSFITIAWVLNPFKYQLLSLFVENLIEQKFLFRWYQKIFLGINILISTAFMFDFAYYLSEHSHIIFYSVMQRMSLLSHLLCMIPTIIIISYRLCFDKKLPIILKKQVSLLVKFILIPHILFNIVEHITFFSEPLIANSAGIRELLSTLSLVTAVIYCSFYLTRFRLFNFTNRVGDLKPPIFTTDVAEGLVSMGKAENPTEALYLTQFFFEKMFGVSPQNLCLKLRDQENYCSANNQWYTKFNIHAVETFLNKEDTNLALLELEEILVYDEIAFDAYYTGDKNKIELLEFLERIDCEIFVPIFGNKKVIGYLLIKKSSEHKLYSQFDQSKISMFCSYLSCSLNIMNHTIMLPVLESYKQVKDDLYFKDQILHQYKESLRALMRQQTDIEVGVIFYHEKKFTFASTVACNLLPINLNESPQHPITQALIKLAEHVESFKTVQSVFLYDAKNKQFMVTCMPQMQAPGVVMSIHYPDTSDIVKAQMDMIGDPSKSDYLLYLETTQAGRLINQMIPSNGATLLLFKIKLLEIALQRKAVLLSTHLEDVESMVQIIHKISLRSQLHKIDLRKTSTPHDLDIKLFGLNRLLAKNTAEPLLKMLDKEGILFIQNIDFASIESQNKLAHFIAYGQFTITKSEQKLVSDVRIICSVSKDPQILLQENKLSATLYNNLESQTLVMPSLMSLSKDELDQLIDGFAYQEISENDFYQMLQLTKEDKKRLLDYGPVSLYEFKHRVMTFMDKKSKEMPQHFTDIVFDPIYNAVDPKLIQVAKLGKYALRDSEMMTMLWNQFKCQTKISEILGVNRSSVSRRCKKYNLTDTE